MKKKNIKKIISIFSAIIICLTFSVTSSAYDFVDDVRTDFLFDYGGLYLTEETKAGDLRYFGERFQIKDEDGNLLSADDYITTGCTLIYFDKIDWFHIHLVGDIDCDGKITSSDARTALRIAAGLYLTNNPDKHGVADADNSGILQAADAREILRVAAKLDNFEKFKIKFNERLQENEQVTIDPDYDYSISVILHPDYEDAPERFDPGFFNNAVKEVKPAANGFLHLILHEPTYDNATVIRNELKAHNAIILSELY